MNGFTLKSAEKLDGATLMVICKRLSCPQVGTARYYIQFTDDWGDLHHTGLGSFAAWRSRIRMNDRVKAVLSKWDPEYDDIVRKTYYCRLSADEDDFSKTMQEAFGDLSEDWQVAEIKWA